MGKLQSKADGYYLLECQVGNVSIHKALMQSDLSIEKVRDLPDTDDFYLNIPDQPIKQESE